MVQAVLNKYTLQYEKRAQRQFKWTTDPAWSKTYCVFRKSSPCWKKQLSLFSFIRRLSIRVKSLRDLNTPFPSCLFPRYENVRAKSFMRKCVWPTGSFSWKEETYFHIAGSVGRLVLKKVKSSSEMAHGWFLYRSRCSEQKSNADKNQGIFYSRIWRNWEISPYTLLGETIYLLFRYHNTVHRSNTESVTRTRNMHHSSLLWYFDTHNSSCLSRYNRLFEWPHLRRPSGVYQKANLNTEYRSDP